MDAEILGVRLSQYRQRLGLSITELANQSGVDYMQIYRYENGKTLPSLDTAVRLSGVLKVSLDELITGDQPPRAFGNERLLESMRQLGQLPDDRQAIALRILDTVIHELATSSSP